MKSHEIHSFVCLWFSSSPELVKQSHCTLSADTQQLKLQE